MHNGKDPGVYSKGTIQRVTAQPHKEHHEVEKEGPKLQHERWAEVREWREWAADPRASYNPICVRKHKYTALFIQTLEVLDTATSNSSPALLRTASLFYRLNCFQEPHARGEQTCPSSASCYGKSQTFATTERNPGVPTPSFRNHGLLAKLAASPPCPPSPHPSAHPKLTSRPRDVSSGCPDSQSLVKLSITL